MSLQLTSASVISFTSSVCVLILGSLFCLLQAYWPHSLSSFHPLVLLYSFFPLSFLFYSQSQVLLVPFICKSFLLLMFLLYLTFNFIFTFPHIHSKICNFLVLIPEAKSTDFSLPFKSQGLSLYSFGSCFHLSSFILPSLFYC